MRIAVETMHEAWQAVEAARMYLFWHPDAKGHCNQSCACGICASARRLLEVREILADQANKEMEE